MTLLVGLTRPLGNADWSVDSVALNWARSAQPQAHWQVTRRSLEPWAKNVQRGAVRFTVRAGPAWIIELSAPAGSARKTYRAVIVVSAISGSVSGASILATDEP